MSDIIILNKIKDLQLKGLKMSKRVFSIVNLENPIFEPERAEIEELEYLCTQLEITLRQIETLKSIIPNCNLQHEGARLPGIYTDLKLSAN